MTANQLGLILREMYENAHGDRVAMIHLFGVKYAKEIRENDIVPREILKAADMKESYFAEINKGIKLAKYVDVKDRYK